MDLSELTRAVEDVSTGYAQHGHIERTDDWLVLKLNEEVGELTQAYLAITGQARDKGRTAERLDAEFRAELADVFAHVLLVAHRFDVELIDEVRAKWLVWQDARDASAELRTPARDGSTPGSSAPRP